jgi:hypothetical protein
MRRTSPAAELARKNASTSFSTEAVHLKTRPFIEISDEEVHFFGLFSFFAFAQ